MIGVSHELLASAAGPSLHHLLLILIRNKVQNIRGPQNQPRSFFTSSNPPSF